MYLEYWGFKRPPFDNIPDPDFFYMSGPHVEGLTRLIYAARMRKGCALLAGDIGCGKTALSGVFIRKISSEKRCDIALISNPCQETGEFLQDVLYFDRERVEFFLGHDEVGDQRGPCDCCPIRSDFIELL